MCYIVLFSCVARLLDFALFGREAGGASASCAALIRSCTKRKLLSIIGQLQHACGIVKQGRAFLQRMIEGCFFLGA